MWYNSDRNYTGITFKRVDITEVWKDIEGYEGLYAVSNYGRVKSLRRNTILKKRTTKDGYIKVTLTVNYKAKDFTVHRLVAKAFIENANAEKNSTVNHIDGNKENNHFSNLEWVDRKEQLYHAYKLGLKKPMAGVDNPHHKLSEDDIRFIRSHYKRNSRDYNTVTLGKMFGVDNSIIGKVVHNTSYKNVK